MVEKYNAQSKYFMYNFVQMLRHKGHTVRVEFYNNILKKYIKANGKAAFIEELVQTKDISDNRYKLLDVKKNINDCTHEELMELERYYYKKKFKLYNDPNNMHPDDYNDDILDDIDEEKEYITLDFLDRWYGKAHIINNHYKLINKKVFKPDDVDFTEYAFNSEEEITKEQPQKVLDYNKAINKEKVKQVRKLIEILGFDPYKVDPKKYINRAEFVENLTKCTKESPIFTNPKLYNKVFGGRKNYIQGTVNSKSLMHFINGLLKNYGLTINYKRKVTKVKVRNIWKSKTVYKYCINYYENINKYL